MMDNNMYPKLLPTDGVPQLVATATVAGNNSNSLVVSLTVENPVTGKRDVFKFDFDQQSQSYQLLLSKYDAQRGRFVGVSSTRELVERIGEF
jgi:hypothetical protein